MITEDAESRLEDFIRDCCAYYSIDESHGLKHSRGCMRLAGELLRAEQGVSDDETRMAIYAAGLHDMCDKKYTDPVEASDRIRRWLTTHEMWSKEDAESLIAIINSMSYSWLKSRMEHDTPVYPDHGAWQRAYHIARHADLLEGYIVARCFLYGKHVTPSLSDEECWKKVHDLFAIRVFRYVTDGWIFLPRAVSIAYELDAVARRDLETRNPIYD